MKKKITLPVTGFDPVPSLTQYAQVAVRVVRSAPPDADAVGIPVAEDGAVPKALGLDRATLAAAGFDGKVGQALLVPKADGPLLVAVGVGKANRADASALRDAAAAFARAAAKGTHLATSLPDAGRVKPEVAAQAVVEGMVSLVTIAERGRAATAGAERGRTLATAGALARDLANAPPKHLTAEGIASVARRVGKQAGLAVEVFDKDAIARLELGGLLGVNAGSVEPPRVVRMTYRPKGKSSGHLILVGKGLTYDSGGINIKPRDPMHAVMKMDMSGAGAVLAAMSALPALGVKATVTGYLMCTDNMPSGSAMKMGDVLTQRGGRTIEINNTDAEGRLALADGLVLAVEQKPDAVVNIGTLTGACMLALGDQIAGVFANNQRLAEQVKAAAARTDESVWQLPLDKRYRKQLESNVADMENMGDAAPGAITAALYLAEFVGDTPWAHLDICGPMQVTADESWRSRGATGFGARLLAELAAGFAPPKR
ncbi:MAG: leucyl aminopeptidase [Betaproteobacteria bacterium]|nr:leucyl aminopeptidase [Betaproteobacteria bacterium]